MNKEKLQSEIQNEIDRLRDSLDQIPGDEIYRKAIVRGEIIGYEHVISIMKGGDYDS